MALVGSTDDQQGVYKAYSDDSSESETFNYHLGRFHLPNAECYSADISQSVNQFSLCSLKKKNYFSLFLSSLQSPALVFFTRVFFFVLCCLSLFGPFSFYE